MSEVIRQLDDCIKDCEEFDFSRQIDDFIADNNGRAFWKKCFPSKLSVGWSEFFRCFYTELELPLPSDPRMNPLNEESSDAELRKAAKEQLKAYARLSSKCAKKVNAELSRRQKEKTAGEMYRIISDDGEMTEELRDAYALKALLNADLNEVVTVDEFGKLLERLGPLEIPDSNSGQCFMNRVGDLASKPWFHGEVPTKTAENMLKTEKPKTFLVRFSNSSRNSYCISSVSVSRKVKHQTIPHTPGLGVQLGKGKQFESMVALIEEEGSNLNLEKPVPNSKFAWLYGEDIAFVEGYGTDA
jgi:hypothetical protein